MIIHKMILMKRNKFESEYMLHKLTERNLKNLFDLEFVASEIQLNKLRIDNLAFDEKTKTFVIIEYKNELDLNVINQAQEYYDLIRNNPEYFADRLDNKRDIDFENTRVMIIGPEFIQSQINNSNDNFEIWKITLYDDGKVIYENMKTDETKELMTVPEELELTEEKILSDRPRELRELYLNFKEKVMDEFDGIKLIYLVKAVSFRANNQIACIFRLEIPAKIHYHTDELEDIENKTRDISNISTGAKANYELILNSKDEIDYALDLFRQVYLQKEDDKDE